MKFKQAFKEFVRNLTSWAWQHEVDCTASIVRIKSMQAEGSNAKVDLEFSPEVSEYFVKALAGILVGCDNYREAKLVVVDSGQEIIVTIQKGNGKTPHQKRQEAETEIEKQKLVIDKLKRELAALKEFHQDDAVSIEGKGGTTSAGRGCPFDEPGTVGDPLNPVSQFRKGGPMDEQIESMKKRV